MDWYMYYNSEYGHIVCVRVWVKLLACCYIRVLEAIGLRDLEENSMVHSSESTFEV